MPGFCLNGNNDDLITLILLITMCYKATPKISM